MDSLHSFTSYSPLKFIKYDQSSQDGLNYVFNLFFFKPLILIFMELVQNNAKVYYCL